MNLIHPLTLIVQNSEQLEVNSQVQHKFDQRGGKLGASEKAQWCLKDRLGAVLPEHARIDYTDGQFTLCDLSGQTFINGSLSPLGRDRQVILSQGDELQLGPFRVKVYLGDPCAEQDIDQVVGTPTDGVLDGWLSEKTENSLSEMIGVKMQPKDPLWALMHEQGQALLTPDSEPVEHAFSTALPAFSASEDTMDQRYVELPSINHPYAGSGFDDNLDSMTLTPLMRGLGFALPVKDAAQQREMLEEMGKSLRAMIEGLLALQNGHAALAETHLRPIEDNPLRLGLDYAETLPLLFAEGKSPVHLSAPAAVAEVLKHVRLHQAANQQAIAAALESILQAFSPAALLDRFANYRRSSEPPSLDDGWAWQMYQHYFRELTSPRQQGFQKLFHQVYAQAYDRAVRQPQDAK